MKSIYENVAYGVRINHLAKSREHMDEIVMTSLQKAGLWDEVKDQLQEHGGVLSGGQQQRMVIARVIATSPDLILMDEPCSALDPIATAKIEQTIAELREEYSIVVVTHSMSQAKRLSAGGQVAFFYEGKLVEKGPGSEVFDNPKDEKTFCYITGRFG